MQRHFDQDLERLRERLLRMAGILETMIENCLTALREGRLEALDRVFEMEHSVNLLQRELFESGVRLIALHQPVADDLRFLIAALSINTDLERMSDQTINVARKILDLRARGVTEFLEKLERMLETVQKMVVRSVEAFLRREAVAAEEVIRTDDQVDRARDEVTRMVIDSIPGDRETACDLIEALLAARNIERIADHATNVAEDVIYLVRGKDVLNQFGPSSHEKPGSWRQIRNISAGSAKPGGSS